MESKIKHTNLKVSVCVTTFNESGETIKRLFDALNNQTLKPHEIIIIDAKNYNNCSRSEGRNIAIKKARNEIIAITDAGCVPRKDWLEKIIKPLGPTSSRLRGMTPDVVAGGYKMVVNNKFEKAESVFLGVSQKDMGETYMPSARSMALTKSIWKKAGGFPENLKNTGEDTLFNTMLLEVGAKFASAPDAIVDWYLPKTISEFARKIYNYAKGDAESGIWWHPVKKWKTHNIKILTIFARYAFGLWLLVVGHFSLYIFIALYLVWSYRKAGPWGILLQFVSDIGCIIGFSHGILQTGIKRN